MRVARLVTLPLLVVLPAACTDAPTATRAPASPLAAAAPSLERGPQVIPVMWHAQQAALGHSGIVPDASAQLVRTPNGLSFRISTTGLTPGNAYTLWLVVVNNPAACKISPCTPPEIFGAGRGQVRFAAGHVAGGSGNGTFAGAVQEGPLSGWVAGRSLEDAAKAEVHLVINDHGPMIPELMPAMIQTYRAGCSDDSPYPPPFRATTALDDGAEFKGPNICRLYQAAVFSAP